MKIGTVFDQTSTTEFLVMLDAQLSDEQLLFSYVELRSPHNGDRIIGRITNVFKENPLLSRDQAGVSASIDLAKLGIDFSRRFTYGWATCNVIGALTARGLDMNRRGVSPNDDVYTPEEKTLRQLFYSSYPSYIPIGEIETLGNGSMSSVPVTLNADQMVTKHFCIFGMTGSGKTNTSAKILEELMARGHRMVIFDSHDDYINLERLTNLFRDVDINGNPVDLECTAEEYHRSIDLVVDHINQNTPQDHPFNQQGFPLRDWVAGRLLQTASLVYGNRPARQLVKDGGIAISEALINAISGNQTWTDLVVHPRVRNYRVFPELRDYGPNFRDFTIQLLSAVQGEQFSSAQWRWLRDNINQAGSGITYLRNLWRAVDQSRINEETKNVLRQRFNSLQAIYRELQDSGAIPLDFEQFFLTVASIDEDSHAIENVHRLSLSDLSSNLRKALVYGIVTYFFRQFKFGGYRARETTAGSRNAHSTLFVLEEARSLIPKSSGLNDDDTAGALARRAMRELAYEGRKFSLGFGLISQKPASVDQEVVSQANTFILHQLKSPDDQQYVRSVTESMSSEELDMIKGLGTGRAIVAGVAVKSPVLLRLHYRYSEEGIPEPTPIHDYLQSVDQIRDQLNIRDE